GVEGRPAALCLLARHGHPLPPLRPGVLAGRAHLPSPQAPWPGRRAGGRRASGGNRAVPRDGSLAAPLHPAGAALRQTQLGGLMRKLIAVVAILAAAGAVVLVLRSQGHTSRLTASERDCGTARAPISVG